MTKRFIEPNKECRVIKNTKTGETAIYYDTEDGLMFLKWLNNLSDENEQLKDAIIGKIQYGEDLEKFAIEKGLIQEDWARFDDYD